MSQQTTVPSMPSDATFDRVISILKWILILAAVIAVIGLPYIADNYMLHLAILSGIAVIAAQSLNLVMGYVGKLSLGHAAFYGIGAYTSAMLSMWAGVPTWLAILAAPLASAFAALLIGPIVLWLRGAYFIIVTLSFSIVLQLVVVNWVDLTNGPMGILGIPYPAIGSFEFASKTSYFYLVVASAALTTWCIRRLVDSRIGRAFEALRENENVAMSIGVSKLYYSLLAFCIGAGFAGFAGALYAHYVSVITPEMFGFDVMVGMLVMVAVGGKGTLAGPIIGAILVTFVPEQLRLVKEFRLSIFGIVLMLSVVLLPDGLTSLGSIVRGFWRHRRTDER
jgi:branched-chain amino acid transport system permease protein